MLSPQGRVVLVSGANRGIGLAVARCLHGKGYALSLGARDVAALEGKLGDLADERLLAQRFDAEDPNASEAWIEATLARYGRIDALVNNAGIIGPARIEDGEAAFDRLWAVNVKAPLRMIRLCLPHLKRSGSGRVVNVASLSGKRVINDNAGYAMSKFAVMALTDAARRVAWDEGVRATAVCPGLVATDMTAAVDSVASEDMTQPEDVAELVALAIALPNNAVMAELLVNCRLESLLA